MRRVFQSLVVVSLLSVGTFSIAQEIDNLNEPTKAVSELVSKYNLEQVNYNYVKKVIGKGNRSSTSAILIDARPEIKYQKGTIPSSLNIPDTKFDEYYSVLKDVAKNRELIVFCGGFNCTKSAIVAQKLKENGHSNVKVYLAGEPEWNEISYLEIDTSVVKAYQEKNLAFLVDARPYPKYIQETIPGAISIPDVQIDKLIGRFPINKKEKIIIFCGGFECEKSHIIANKLISLEYKDVTVYAGGLPAWKDANLSTTASSIIKSDEKKVEKKEQFSKNGLKMGGDSGSVDGEWIKKLIQEDKVPSFIQIVDVRPSNEFDNGHFKGAINIEAAKFSAKEFLEKLPKNKTIVFNCSAGGRSIDAWSKLNDAKLDVSEIYYLDANITCKGSDCKIDVNESLL